MHELFNTRLRQLILLAVLILLIWVCFVQLTPYIPGVLGAVAMYILSRASYFHLVYAKKWAKWKAALIFIFYYLLLIGLPTYLAITLISPKLNMWMHNPEQLILNIKETVGHLQDKLGIRFISDRNIDGFMAKMTDILPGLLNSTASVVFNISIMLFFLYYMLYYGSEMEKVLYRIVPLKDENTQWLAFETKRIVRANAIGIPLVAMIQGIVAAAGYLIFGVENWGLWGFMTGIAAFIPVVGTLIVWVPLILHMYANGPAGPATGLLIYSVVVIGNADYVARITLMKRLSDVHPMITIPGIIIGLGLFGIMGLIFGPLLVSYIILLFRIYLNEFVHNEPETNVTQEPVVKPGPSN